MIPFSPFPKILGGFIGRDHSSFLKTGYSIDQLIHLKQIHSDRIHWLREKSEIPKVHLAEGDAIISTLENVPISVRAADCVPILLAHPSGVVAAIHAGWRGTQLKIVQKTVLEIVDKLLISILEVKLVIGPSICGECYEVGEEVATHFASSPGVVTHSSSSNKFLLNLKLANQLQAIETGIPPSQIEISEKCTLCDEKEFYSYRGELKRGKKGEGRNYGWIVRKS